jgi:hypothetical protein
MYIYVDGELLNSGGIDISTVTLTLDNVGESLRIGARKNTSIQSYFTGQLSNFQLYKAADYNLPALLNANIRESACSGTTTLINSASSRINNLFYNNGTGATGYNTTTINVSEGFYDIIALSQYNTTNGIVELSIDGVTVSTRDTYGASPTYNNKDTTKNVFISGGTHILKQFSDTKNGTATGYLQSFQMIELIKRDGEYNESDEATSGILFGDEINQRGNITWNNSPRSDSVFNNNVAGGTASDGDYNEGDIFIKKGNYKITYTYLTYLNGGIADIYFGGVKTHNQIDQYSTGLGLNTSATRSVFLEGGKTNVKIICNGKNGSSTDHFIQHQFIRFELISGKGNGDEVNIWNSDDDIEPVVGGTYTVAINTSRRFNSFLYASARADGDKFLFRRYFSGGTYTASMLYSEGADTGILDIGVDSDSTAVFNQLDTYSASADSNKKSYSTVTISRGFHDISFLVNGKNASSSNYYTRLINLQFKKIATVLDSVNDDNSDGVHGSMVPLANYTCRLAEATKTLNLSHVNAAKYSRILLKVNMRATAALVLQLEFNGLTTYYSYDYGRRTGGTLTEVTAASQAHFDLIDATVLSGDAPAYALVEIDLGFTGGIAFSCYGGTAGTGETQVTGGGRNTGFNITPLTEILLSTDTSTWKAGTTFDVYGVLK